MENIQTAVKRGFAFGADGVRIRVAKKHEYIPDAKLGGEGNRVVEQCQVPAGAVRSWGDIKLSLKERCQHGAQKMYDDGVG